MTEHTAMQRVPTRRGADYAAAPAPAPLCSFTVLAADGDDAFFVAAPSGPIVEAVIRDRRRRLGLVARAVPVIRHPMQPLPDGEP